MNQEAHGWHASDGSLGTQHAFFSRQRQSMIFQCMNGWHTSDGAAGMQDAIYGRWPSMTGKVMIFEGMKKSAAQRRQKQAQELGPARRTGSMVDGRACRSRRSQRSVRAACGEAEQVEIAIHQVSLPLRRGCGTVAWHRSSATSCEPNNPVPSFPG